MTLPKGRLTYRVDQDIEFAFPLLSFLILSEDTDDETAILVDTGVKSSDSQYMRKRERHIGGSGGGPEPLERGLSEFGLVPEDIDYVVLTHLHYDHASNNDLFSDSEFLIQRTEYETARKPLPMFETTYPAFTTDSIDDDQLTLLEGDYRLCDGIELLQTPGHSTGMQSVVVETSTGPVALVADLAYFEHSLHPGIDSMIDAHGKKVEVTSMRGDYLPPGSYIDLIECYESIERVRRWIGSEGEIVPSHDPQIAERTHLSK
jgi:glyoxylase-like metal-dependent hydrolase (beta-lactamase superfamily II)